MTFGPFSNRQLMESKEVSAAVRALASKAEAMQRQLAWCCYDTLTGRVCRTCDNDSDWWNWWRITLIIIFGIFFLLLIVWMCYCIFATPTYGDDVVVVESYPAYGYGQRTVYVTQAAPRTAQASKPA